MRDCRLGIRLALWGVACIGSAVAPHRAATAQHPLEFAGQRWTQDRIETSQPSLRDLRLAGLRVFATPFVKRDGYGERYRPGEAQRPTLGANGTYLRVDGLDAQSCVECHYAASMATVPLTLGVGGTAGISSSPILEPTIIDARGDATGDPGYLDGRLINPPMLFGSGAVQQVALEMTADLQRLKARALARPGRWVRLLTKGVSFGRVRARVDGTLDTRWVDGVDDDLVLRPFGRKGEFRTLREFSVSALEFHLGMQASEAVGEGIDADGDGVTDEILAGEVSALQVFLATQETPFIKLRPGATAGQLTYAMRVFRSIGCADCHRPELRARSRTLAFEFPESAPGAGVAPAPFFEVDLGASPAAVPTTAEGRLIVRLFSDLKRHDMGAALAENFHGADAQRNREFITAKLWGVSDTGPWLHDGRALTLREAIVMHGGEARAARDAYVALPPRRQTLVLDLLRAMRNPVSPNKDVVMRSRQM